jgi:hypothetical protein
MVDFARQSTEDRLRHVPNQPQYRRFRGKELIDWMFIELPENEVNYCLSIGIYQ